MFASRGETSTINEKTAFKNAQEHAPAIHCELKEQVSRLAAPPEVAETYLRKLGTWDCLDELALELEDSIDILRRVKGRSEAQDLALRKIEDALREMSGPDGAELWYGTEAYAGLSGKMCAGFRRRLCRS